MFSRGRLSINSLPFFVIKRKIIVSIIGATPSNKSFGGMEVVSELYTLLIANTAWIISHITNTAKMRVDLYLTDSALEFLTAQ